MGLVVKTVLLGDRAVGKTTLRRNFIGRGFQTNYIFTIGAEFSVKEQKVDYKTWKFQVWQLAEQPRFQSIRPVHYAGALGAILIYDVTRPESLENLEKWVYDLLKYTGDRKIPLLVLANKVDLRQDAEHCVTTEQGLVFAEQLKKEFEEPANIGFLEISVVTGLNVKKIFSLLAWLVMLNQLARRDSKFSQCLSPSLFRRSWIQHIDFETLKIQNNYFCPFCGTFNLLLGRDENTRQKRIFCGRCGNQIC
ncbi:MAG: Rab family GTPase [Candidatus Hodarchaeota archaeon]